MQQKPTSIIYDPNRELSESDIYWAQIAGGGAFRRCGLKPQAVEGYPCKTLVYCEMGAKRYMVYVRVTHSEDEEQGTGPMPMVLFEAAKDFDAEPFVVRENMTAVGQGVAFKYWGVDELEAMLKSNPEWKTQLLRGRSVQDFLRLKDGKLSQLHVEVSYEPFREPYPDEGDSPEGKVVPGFHGWTVRVFVDGKSLSRIISVPELARAAYRNDEHFIVNCWCGEPGCASINNGVVVVTDGDLTVWKVYSVSPRRVFVFDSRQYRQEIVEKLTQFVRSYKALPQEVAFGGDYEPCLKIYVGRIEYLEQALYEAREEPAIP